MEFVWTDEHGQLRETVRAVLADRAPVTRARELAEAGDRHDPELWAELATGLGLSGIALPESYGGSGGTLVDLAVVAEEMGRVLFGGPFFPTVALAAPALLASGDEAACAEYLPRIADGSLTATLVGAAAEPGSVARVSEPGGRVRGGDPLVLDAAGADLLLVAAQGEAGPTLFAVEQGAAGLEVGALETLDMTRQMASVRFEDVAARRVGRDGEAVAALTAARETAAILLAAEQAGGMATCVEMTSEYARTRRQFGRLIGSFQGVKHRLADMAVRRELGRSAAYWAAWQPPGTPAAAFGASAALSYCSEAYLQTALDTVQLHGGIGFTWEHDAHLFVRRARAAYSLLGDPVQHRARLEPAVLDAAAKVDPSVTSLQEVPA